MYIYTILYIDRRSASQRTNVIWQFKNVNGQEVVLR